MIKRNSVFSFGPCEIHRLGIEGDDVVPGKFIDSARNITWKMYDVPIFLDFGLRYMLLLEISSFLILFLLRCVITARFQKS